MSSEVHPTRRTILKGVPSSNLIDPQPRDKSFKHVSIHAERKETPRSSFKFHTYPEPTSLRPSQRGAEKSRSVGSKHESSSKSPRYSRAYSYDRDSWARHFHRRNLPKTDAEIHVSGWGHRPRLPSLMESPANSHIVSMVNLPGQQTPQNKPNLDSSFLFRRIRNLAEDTSFIDDEVNSAVDDDEHRWLGHNSVGMDYPETFYERVRRLEFERRRKLHYTEFHNVALARELIRAEFGDDDDDEEDISKFDSENRSAKFAGEEYDIEGEHAGDDGKAGTGFASGSLSGIESSDDTNEADVAVAASERSSCEKVAECHGCSGRSF